MSYQYTYPLADDDQFQQPLGEDDEDKNQVAFHGLSLRRLQQPMPSDEKPQAETSKDLFSIMDLICCYVACLGNTGTQEQEPED